MPSRENAVLNLLTLFFSVLAIILFLPPIAQSPNYHDFADSQTMFGVANFLNVASNIAILAAGVLGLLFLFRKNSLTVGNTFRTAAEWWPYLVFFIGVTATAFGSAYYHWAPSNETLVWDRLPMTVMFMGLFCGVLAERISPRAGFQLCLPLVMLGMATIVNWTTTEHLGLGDLRLYAVVQFFPMVAVPAIMYLFPARYTAQKALLLSFGWYILAKVFEGTDALFYDLIGVSGHTIKHVLCGLSAYWVLKMLRERVARPEQTASSKP
jgi:Alkaline phytoceramidase (aPHC).